MNVYIEATYSIKGVFNVPNVFCSSKYLDEWIFDHISKNLLTEHYSADKVSETFTLEHLDKHPNI